VASTETRDPIGYLVAGLSRLAQTDLLDRWGLRKQAEQAVFTVTRSGFSTITRAGRTFTRAGSRGKDASGAGGAAISASTMAKRRNTRRRVMGPPGRSHRSPGRA